MTVRVVTPPLYEPVSRDQAIEWIRAESADVTAGQQAILDLLIKGMRGYAENLTGRAFVQRTLELTLPGFPTREIVLPRAPLASVTHIKYYDHAGVLQTVDAADYEVDTYSEPGKVQPAYLENWEGTRNVFNAVQVRYVAGYPVGSPQDEAAYRENVPAEVKLWMHARIATLWKQREQLVTGTIVQALPRDFADGLLDSLRLGTIFG